MKFSACSLVLLSLVAFCGFSLGQKHDGGFVVGKLKSRTNTQDGKNSNFEVLAPGEEKPRSYHVIFDQKLKKPMPMVLEAVRSANIGDTVELEWQKTNHGPAVNKFKVIAKAKGSE